MLLGGDIDLRLQLQQLQQRIVEVSPNKVIAARDSSGQPVGRAAALRALSSSGIEGPPLTGAQLPASSGAPAPGPTSRPALASTQAANSQSASRKATDAPSDRPQQESGVETLANLPRQSKVIISAATEQPQQVLAVNMSTSSQSEIKGAADVPKQLPQEVSALDSPTKMQNESEASGEAPTLLTQEAKVSRKPTARHRPTLLSRMLSCGCLAWFHQHMEHFHVRFDIHERSNEEIRLEFQKLKEVTERHHAFHLKWLLDPHKACEDHDPRSLEDMQEDNQILMQRLKDDLVRLDDRLRKNLL